ncbi:hypothetical protein [Psychrobacter sp. AOP31-A1-22]|uniref:hypothetical protein n=1 Tax=Psychrobacter sp. AOP31-A1-22 TaxID=3457696 RepID=UPI0040351B42
MSITNKDLAAAVSEKFKGHDIDVVTYGANNKTITVSKGGADNVYSDGLYITTWDHHLAVSGGFGNFIFRHLACKDMLALFATKEIDTDYLLESLKAGEALEFSADKAKELIKDYILEWAIDLDEEEKTLFTPTEMQATINDATTPIGKDIYSADALDYYLGRYENVIDGIATPLTFNTDFIDVALNRCNQVTWSYEFICYAVSFIANKLLSQDLKKAS